MHFFSPDSKHYFTAVTDGEKWRAVIDGKAGREYDEISYIPGAVYSPDRKHVTYIGHNKKEGKEIAIVKKFIMNL